VTRKTRLNEEGILGGGSRNYEAVDLTWDKRSGLDPAVRKILVQ
jgi:hypothetical protein